MSWKSSNGNSEDPRPFIDFAVSTMHANFLGYFKAPAQVKRHPSIIQAALQGASGSHNADRIMELLDDIQRSSPSFWKRETKYICKAVENVAKDAGWEQRERFLKKLPRSFPFFREVAIQCLWGNGHHYKSLPEDLKRDGTLICIAVRYEYGGTPSSWAAEAVDILWSQRCEVFRALKENKTLPKPIPLEYTTDCEFRIAYLQRHSVTYSSNMPDWFPRELLKDPSFVLEVAQRNASILGHCKEDVVNMDMVLAACRACKDNLHSSSHHCSNFPCEDLKAEHATMANKLKLWAHVQSLNAFQRFLRGVVQARKTETALCSIETLLVRYGRLWEFPRKGKPRR